MILTRFLQLFVPQNFRSRQRSNKKPHISTAPDMTSMDTDLDCLVESRSPRKLHTSGVHQMRYPFHFQAETQDPPEEREVSRALMSDQDGQENIQDGEDGSSYAPNNEHQDEVWKRLTSLPPDHDTKELLKDIYDGVQADWSSDKIRGNLYKVLAFGSNFNISAVTEEEREEGKVTTSWIVHNIVKPGGWLIVVLIQVFGPYLITYHYLVKTFDCGLTTDTMFPGYDVWSKEFLEMYPTRLLACGFLYAFVLNSIKMVDSEKQNARRVFNVFYALFTGRPNARYFWLYFGPLVNCYLAISCSIVVFFVLGAAEDPKDVVFDSLAILFIFNLDDIEGNDLAILDDDNWLDFQFGWVHKMLKEDAKKQERGEESTELHAQFIKGSISHEGGLEVHQFEAVKMAYHVTYWILLVWLAVLPIVFVSVPWTTLSTCGKDDALPGVAVSRRMLQDLVVNVTGKCDASWAICQ